MTFPSEINRKWDIAISNPIKMKKNPYIPTKKTGS